jgi:hypothetical protein
MYQSASAGSSLAWALPGSDQIVHRSRVDCDSLGTQDKMTLCPFYFLFFADDD